MSDYVIRPYAYSDADAAKLAVMWNESDDQWPGTFTDGVPMTTERVREWLDRETGLAMLVVDDPTRERIVGYGSLWDEHEREHECYVAVLNVHPAHQGRSLARRMLSQMVDQAVELGYRLMTIGTWPSNLKSVPLYKKVGFFWVPDTNVHMENFVPLIRQMPIAQSYFRQHDWYATFRRDLLQVEDDERHGAMKVYRYHWEQDGDSLSVLIDRQAKAATGLETQDLAVYVELDEIEPAHGLPYAVRWRVSNKQAATVNVSILASGDPGVQIAQQTAFVLEGGQERVVEGSFTVSPDIKPVKKDRPAPSIKTVLVAGGDVVELGTGVRPRAAIEISTEPEYPVLLPGQAGTVHVQLQNHLDRPLQGVVSLAPVTGLHADWESLRHPFTLGEKGYAGLPLTITCDDAGAVALHLSTSFEVDEKLVQSRSKRVTLFNLPPGGVAAGIGEGGDEGEVIVVENEFFRLHCRSEGGRCAVWDKVNTRVISAIREELGPPFVPSELWFKHYELSLERGDGQVKVLLRARSNNFPGLTFTKELTVSASPLVVLRYRLANEASQTHTVQLNPRLWMGERQRAWLTLPRSERLVRERAALFASTHGDVPEKPEGMAERWLAWCVDGLALGLIWSDDVEKHEWEWSTVNFDRRSVTLDPGSTAEMAPFYIYAGPGDWADVRHAWTRLAGRTPQRAQSLQPEHKLEFGFDPSPIITLSDQVDVALYADNVRELPVDGQIVVEMPQGWRAEPTEFVLNELKHKHPLNAPLRLDASGASIGAYTGQLHLKGNRFDATQTFTLIRLGDETAQVRMTEMVGGDYPLFLLDNGYSRWHIAPSYHAGVVTWEEGNSDINHLLCAYPQEGGAELSWLKPWFGGIHPMLMPDGEDEGWPGKLHEEKFIPEPCQRTEHGVNWSGLRLCAQLDREQFRGLRAEVEYLTAGQSNLLRVVYRLINETGIYRLVTPGLLAFLQPDGRYDNSALHADGVELKRAPIMTWIVVGNWGAATNPESGKTLVVVKETPGAWLELSDWAQDGGHVFGFNRTCIPPQSQTEMIVYLALTDTLQDARRYAALGR